MAKIAARKASLALESGSAYYGISSYVSSITLTFSAESTDVSGFGDDNRERVADGILDWELKMDGFWASGAAETDGLLSAIRAAGGATAFKLAPAGSGTASPPVYSGCGVLTQYEANFAAADAGKITFTIGARTGSLTRVTGW